MLVLFAASVPKTQISRTSVMLDAGIEPVTFIVIAWLPLGMLMIVWATPSIVKYHLTILEPPVVASLIVAVRVPAVLSATGRAWVLETIGARASFGANPAVTVQPAVMGPVV